MYYNPAYNDSCKCKHCTNQSFPANKYLNRLIFKCAFKVIADYTILQKMYSV